MSESYRSRRSNPKSRQGCSTCKTRKVKCDEQRPSCGNCTKHKVECDFLKVLGPKPENGLNIEDLELLHTYTTSTYATLSDITSMREFYRMTVVRMGFSCHYIMRTLLALASLHIAHDRPHLRSHYKQLALKHHQVATRAASTLLTEVHDVDTAQNLFVFSVMTVFVALSSPQREADADSSEDGFPDWLFLLRGSVSLVELIPAELRMSGPLAPMFNHGKGVWLVLESPSADDLPVSRPLADLYQAIDEQVEIDDSLKGIYRKAIDELLKAYSVLYLKRESWDQTAVFMWLTQADNFLPLVKQEKQEALVILAYFCVLLKRLDHHWCIRGWPENLMRKIVSSLDGLRLMWIRFPMEELGQVLQHRDLQALSKPYLPAHASLQNQPHT